MGFKASTRLSAHRDACACVGTSRPSHCLHRGPGLMVGPRLSVRVSSQGGVLQHRDTWSTTTRISWWQWAVHQISAVQGLDTCHRIVVTHLEQPLAMLQCQMGQLGPAGWLSVSLPRLYCTLRDVSMLLIATTCLISSARVNSTHTVPLKGDASVPG